MKKPGVIVLLILCFSFVAFLSGFYLGRNLNDSPIRLSGLPVTPPEDDTPEDPTPTGNTAGLIDINTATKEQLESLPGIGPVLAQRILDYIRDNGPFESMSQLTLVSGIGVERLNDIMDYATVGGQ